MRCLIKSNMRCIETIESALGMESGTLIKSNMRCIETIFHHLVKHFRLLIKSNMRCIETLRMKLDQDPQNDKE